MTLVNRRDYMKLYYYLILFLALVGFVATVQAANTTHSAPAAQGYDVVSYQVEKRPVRGNGHFTATHEGATYLFSSQQNLDTFNSNPDRFVPAYGGYCAYGVSVGKKFVGDPEVWRVVDNRLYLNLDANVQDAWFEDVPGRIKAADAKWEEIKDKDPASL